MVEKMRRHHQRSSFSKSSIVFGQEKVTKVREKLWIELSLEKPFPSEDIKKYAFYKKKIDIYKIIF